jgi:hypothetical protein
MPGNRFKNEWIPNVPRSASSFRTIHRNFFYRPARNEIPVISQKTVIETVMPNNLRQKTAGSPEEGLPALILNAADGYKNQLSATAEIINTSSAKGTAALTLKVNPSLFTCVNISTEISEFFDRIASTPLIDFGSTVRTSWAVGVLRAQNEQSVRFLKEQHTAKKMPEQNHRPGVEHYSLIKNNSAAAPITAKETEPSKLTTKSALTDNSLNTIRSRNSRTCLRFTTNLLVQGLGACPRRIEPCVFLPLRELEDFISKGASAFLSESILHRKTKALNPTLFSFPKEEKPCAA